MKGEVSLLFCEKLLEDLNFSWGRRSSHKLLEQMPNEVLRTRVLLPGAVSKRASRLNKLRVVEEYKGLEGR